MSKKTNRRARPDLQPVRKELDAIIAKGYGGHRVFEDWVGLMFFAFQRDDPHYLEIMGRYRNDGPMGQREADHFANALAELMGYMSSTNEEVLGPLYEEYAANHYVGQFFTPAAVCKLMARMSHTPPPPNRAFTVCDPACGAGACLIASAQEQSFEENYRAFFVGLDVDVNCVRMTALNLMFFNLEGIVMWGNFLALEVRGAWRTCRNVAFGGSLMETDAAKAQEWLRGSVQPSEREPATARCAKNDTNKPLKMEQLTLFPRSDF